MKLYKTFNTEVEALAAQSVLRSQGIESLISKDDAGGLIPPLGIQSGYKLFVADTSVSAPEKQEPESVSKKSRSSRKLALLIVVLFIGIIAGAFAGIGIDKVYMHYKACKYQNDVIVQSSSNPTIHYRYKGGKVVETIVDRNKDGKSDEWFYFENSEWYKSESDNNFDGKPDAWTTIINNDSAIVDCDTDYNGISDFTEYAKYRLAVKIVYHPNGSKPTQEFYYKNGIVQYQLFSPDSLGRFRMIRHFDRFGNIYNECPWPENL
jgi:hypothetical protein